MSKTNSGNQGRSEAHSPAGIHRVDCHMHTPLCGHAVGNPREYVQAAANNRIDLITFTCHIPMPDDGFRQEGIRMRQSDMTVYRDLIADAQQFGREIGVEVLYGIEAEVSPDSAAIEEMRARIESEPFDFVLGSLHHMLPGYLNHLESIAAVTDTQIIESYFSDLGKAARSNIYDSLAHPDVIRIYGTLSKRFDPAKHETVIKAFLDEVAASNTCLEINTSGLTKGDFVVHPDPVIMDWALERNIPFTMGSDSHRPTSVAQFFDEVLDLFRSRGLKQIHYFRERQRIPITL